MPLRFLHTAVIALIAIACAMTPAPAQAETRIEVLATDPGATSVLHKGENFWLRIGYTTDQPIRLRAEPYLAGKHVPAGNGGSLEVGPGTGESTYWFFFSEPRQIDTVVVTAQTARGTVLAETHINVGLTWVGTWPTARRTPVDWVLRAQEEAQRRAEARSKEPMTFGLMSVVAVVFIIAVPLYWILQPALLFRLHGGWRQAAAIPLAMIVSVSIYVMIAVRDGSNIAPVLLVFASSLGTFYLLGLLALRWYRT